MNQIKHDEFKNHGVGTLRSIFRATGPKKTKLSKNLMGFYSLRIVMATKYRIHHEYGQI